MCLTCLSLCKVLRALCIIKLKLTVELKLTVAMATAPRRCFDRLQPSQWKLGARFRFTANPTCDPNIRFEHRIYWLPPMEWGDWDPVPSRLTQAIPRSEVYCDFNGVHTVQAIFVNVKWTAVQIKLRDQHENDVLVWTNVRKRNDWWAAVV
jgi:hypothetical protein